MDLSYRNMSVIVSILFFFLIIEMSLYQNMSSGPSVSSLKAQSDSTLRSHAEAGTVAPTYSKIKQAMVMIPSCSLLGAKCSCKV